MSFQSLGRSGLARALVLSLAFHFLLLWPSPTTRQAPDSSPTLVATLQAPPTSRPVPPIPDKAQRTAVPVSPTIASRESTPATPLPPPTPVPKFTPSSTAANATRSSPADDAAPSSPSEQAPLDAEGLRGFRIALARQARSYKRYPKRAEEQGWAGTAEVRVTILAGGVPQEPLLSRSSGYAVLDEAAVEMVGKALRTTPVPPTLRQQTFVVDLPVVFELGNP